MASVFVKVSVNDRLPKEDRVYITDLGEHLFSTSRDSFLSRILSENINVRWWLEEIELPSEEDVYSESFTSDKTPSDFINGANFILTKLKGETK